MAGEWIPMRIDLADDPAVIMIAGLLGVDEYAVVGRLHRLWVWVNRHLTSGHAPGVTEQWIDRFLATPGFAAAMRKAGWLLVRTGAVEFPNFERWNSQGAKRRLLAAQRKRAERSQSCHAPGVTETRPKERKGEKKKEETPSESGPEPALPDPGPPVMTFPANGKGSPAWGLTAAKLAEYRDSFPGLDVPAELRKARQWCIDNPKKRKTLRGMAAFLTRWLSKAQDRGPPAAPPPRTSYRDRTTEYAKDTLADIFGGDDASPDASPQPRPVAALPGADPGVG